jgi:GntR family transcriptional regulator/MocR family aminotransferase
MGVTQTLARRFELLEWAREHDAWILEDDYDSEYRYVGRPLSPLKSLDEDGRVLYVGTFSKVLFPSLRIGYVVLPERLVDPFLRMRYASNREAPILEQAVLTRFLEEGHFSRHVRRMRVLYGERQEILRDAAERECGELLRIPRAETGIHVIGHLPRGANDALLSQAAADAGVAVTPLSSFAMTESVDPGFVLGYSAFDEPELRAGMYRLGRVLTEHLR